MVKTRATLFTLSGDELEEANDVRVGECNSVHLLSAQPRWLWARVFASGLGGRGFDSRPNPTSDQAQWHGWLSISLLNSETLHIKS